MAAGIVITALFILLLSKAAKCGRLQREVDYLSSENKELREALFGRPKTASIDDYYDNTKWYEIK